MDAQIASALANERILLTGGAGVLGSHVRERLEAIVTDVFVPRSREYDLRIESEVDRVYREFGPTMVIHAAAVVGGIGYNRDVPATIFDDNARMNFALALVKGNYFSDAAIELEGVLAANPDDINAHLMIGNLYAQKLFDFAKARNHYKRVIGLAPEHPQAVNIRYWLVRNGVQP